MRTGDGPSKYLPLLQKKFGHEIRHMEAKLADAIEHTNYILWALLIQLSMLLVERGYR
jgi:hypothetical protein